MAEGGDEDMGEEAEEDVQDENLLLFAVFGERKAKLSDSRFCDLAVKDVMVDLFILAVGEEEVFL